MNCEDPLHCCVIVGIQSVASQWTSSDCQMFRQLTVGRKFVATIVRAENSCSSETNYCPLVVVYLIDTVSSEDDIVIHEILVQKNIAKLL